MVITVNDILAEKDTQLFFVSPDTLLIDALNLMVDQNIGTLLVMEGDKVVGIISERDFVRQIVLKKDCPLYHPVAEMMTPNVYTITPKDGIEQCMKLMTEKRIRHLPVLEGEKPIGIVSIGDVIKTILESRDFTIRQMENYISGST